MKKTVFYCDHCGKEIDEMHDYTDQEIGLFGYETADLCTECMEELDRNIKKFCGKEQT